MRTGRGLRTLMVLVGAIGLAACNSSYRTTAPTTISVPSTSTPTVHPDLVLSPAEPYPNNPVHITATGLTPREHLVLTECANRIGATRQSDCDQSKATTVTVSGSGKVQTTFVPSEGPFGSKHISCSTPRSCLISLWKPASHSSPVASAPLVFCPPSHSCSARGPVS